MGEIPESGWQPDGGKTSMAGLLGMSDLEDQPANVSMIMPNKLLLRGMYINRSRGSNNLQGLESFLDVTLWYACSWSHFDMLAADYWGLGLSGTLCHLCSKTECAACSGRSLLTYYDRQAPASLASCSQGLPCR
jgi:hypothetical protein